MSYFNTALNGTTLKEKVEEAIKSLNRQKIEFDAVAVRGNSGLAFGAPLVMMMDKDLLIVRKGLHDCHSSDMVEGSLKGHRRKVLIVDDLVISGSTVKTICKRLCQQMDDPQIVGVYCYESGTHKREVEVNRKLSVPILF